MDQRKRKRRRKSGSGPRAAGQDVAPSSQLEWLGGDGEMARTVLAKDWSKTPLGPIEEWPPGLRTTVSLCLASNFPINIIWGPEHTQIYNDGYRVVCGAAHPRALGEAYAVTWASAWPAIGAPFERALEGKTSFLENQRMFLERNGYQEETFFTFSLSPIRNERGRVEGLFHPVTETTARMLSERRTRAIRDVVERAGKARAFADACELAVQVLREHELDLPFVLLYGLPGDSPSARLLACSGVPAGGVLAPAQAPLGVSGPHSGWPLHEVLGAARAVEISDLRSRFGELRAGPYPEPPDRAFLLPIRAGGADRPVAVLIAGASPRLPLDDHYRSFFEMVGASVGGCLQSATAYEQETRRAEALAELDRAKTAFFSNVSHEFRTPLTLILGPVEDALARPEPALTGEGLELVRRNALRLHKMVSSLLDFARVEAGRAQASFAPTDLAAATRDLASTFRSALGGPVTLSVDCAPLPQAVYVDAEMWEKIVLNLVSNAVKYTHEGEIRVGMRWEGGEAVLTVADTGVGIPADEQERIFERFYRARGTQGRSHEGTGIGLSLVHELVKLHGGSVSVASGLGKGTTFTVRIPPGPSHLPPERIAHSSAQARPAAAAPYVEEALRWSAPLAPGLADAAAPAEEVPEEIAAAPILLVDDNADLRAYVGGILRRTFRDVRAAADGQAALEAARRDPPELILSDVMMPRLDGFGLVRELRRDDRLRAIPVILLSARAGAEAATEGLSSGADDYLVKPFSARELLARVRTQLSMVRMRREAVRQEVQAGELREAIQSRDQFLTLAAHELRTPVTALGLRTSLLLRSLKRLPADAEVAGRARRDADKVRHQADRLVRLVELLLDVASLLGGELRMRPEELDVVAVVERVVRDFEEQAAMAGTSIALRAQPACARADAERLTQVLASLISNAIKFGAGKPIEVSVEDRGDVARIAVADQGIGIAAEDQARLFGRFQRAVSERNYGGLGLGLWMSRQLVEAMGGAIRLDSRPGSGATFLVDLPGAPRA